jgi:tRNA G18 (ribose-2'-O)-methylase SpoU
MPKIALLLHNIRSTYNVGSILRTAEGFGVEQIILSGYTPYPEQANDERLPHLRQRLTKQIHKTALGAEKILASQYVKSPENIIQHYQTPDKVLLILGEEVNGIPLGILKLSDEAIEIPMVGQKESFNVSVATGIALYHLFLNPKLVNN